MVSIGTVHTVLSLSIWPPAISTLIRTPLICFLPYRFAETKDGMPTPLLLYCIDPLRSLGSWDHRHNTVCRRCNSYHFRVCSQRFYSWQQQAWGTVSCDKPSIVRSLPAACLCGLAPHSCAANQGPTTISTLQDHCSKLLITLHLALPLFLSIQ